MRSPAAPAPLLALLLLALPLLGSCAGSGAPDPRRLALLPPLPYRIAIGGGAMLSLEQRSADGLPIGIDEEALRTYDGVDAEPIDFAEIVGLLERGNLASAIAVLDAEDAAAREQLAFADASSEAGERARSAAAREGADLLLVLEGLRDAPVIELGVNSRWPIATAAWLLVGLGMFIPDHTFESQVSLRASVRDAHTGAVLVDDLVISPGAVDLSLVERTTWVGIVTSILVPPPLVASNPADYAASVRKSIRDRMALRLLATLKTPEMLERVRRALPIGLELVPLRTERFEVVVRSRQDLLDVAIELGEERERAPREDEERLLAALRTDRAPDPAREGYVHRAELAVAPEHRLVRVLVATVAGERASTTLRLRSP